MKVRAHSLRGAAALCGVLAFASSCSRPSALSPAAPAVSSLRDGRNALEASPVPATPGATFPLSGSFEIRNADGDGIVGTYDGAAQFSDGALQTSSLTLQVSGGSGALAGATGAIVAKGEGAFADEGKFLLDGRGDLTLAT